MKFFQQPLNPNRNYTFWRISHNKIVSYLNNQDFSGGVQDDSANRIATANTVNTVNDVLTGVENYIVSSNSYLTNSETLIGNLEVQNNASIEVLGYANTTIGSKHPDFGIGISEPGNRFNVIPIVNSNGVVEFGSKLNFYSANTPTPIQYSFDNGFNYEYYVLEYLQPSMKLYGADVLINRNTLVTGNLVSGSVVIKTPDMNTVIDSSGNAIGKKCEWLSPINFQGTTGLLSDSPVAVMNGGADNSLSILTGSPKKWTGSGLKLQIMASSFESSNSANLSVYAAAVSGDSLIDTDSSTENHILVDTGQNANSVVSTDQINIDMEANKEDLILIKLTRNVSDPSDTLVGNLYIHGIKLYYDTEVLTDA